MLALTANLGCAPIFGTLLAGVQISDAQRVRSQEITDMIRYQVPDPWVAEVIRKAQRDYLGRPIAADHLALSLTEPTGNQFVAVMVSQPRGYGENYQGYAVRGARYKERWILEKVFETQRPVLKDLPPKEDYALWLFAKINYFNSRLTTELNPDFWHNSKPLFERLRSEGMSPRYKEFDDEFKFVADGVLHTIAAKTESVTIKTDTLNAENTE